MEQSSANTKGNESPLKTILNSPVLKPTQMQTPAVPVPDWSLTSIQTPATSKTTILYNNNLDDPQQSTHITLQNCVATVDLACQLDLMEINFRTRNTEYNPARFTGVVMRIREPRCTALIFKSGKIVTTGARNEQDALLASKKFAKIIQKLGFNIKFTKFKIQNLVATCDLKFPIRLDNLNQMHGQFSSYEPELFPGLIYRMIKPRLVLLIFVNGKIVFTGAKSREDIKEALDNILPILKSFRKKK